LVMDTMGQALWDLFANQKIKGLVGAMRQTLAKLEKSGQADSKWFNAMGELACLEKNYSVAARFFRQALEEKDLPEYELNLGNALFSAGNFNAAKKILVSYLAKHSDDIHGLVNLANCHLQLNELQEVKDLCNQGLEGHIAKSPLWNCLGQVAYLKGDFTKAWGYFNQAYTEAPDYIDALFNRANQAYQLGRVEEALCDFAQCLRKDENYEAALINSAVIRLERGEWSEGKENVLRALKLNPSSVEALYILGRLYLGSKDFRTARDTFRRVLNQDENHIPTLIALAKLEVQEAEHIDALSLLKRALVQKNLSGEERIAALTLMLELGEFNYCIHHLSKSTELHVSNDLMKINIIALWKTGRIADAIQNLEELLKKEGETAGNLTLLGRMLSQSGADALAEVRYQKALEMDPTAKGAAAELARLLLLRGEGNRAAEILEDQLAMHHLDPDCLYNLACCHAKNGNIRASLYNLKLALDHGFQDFDKIIADEDLISIRQSEEYYQLTVHAGLI
jgi:tetratricopeptide (TPR) repeat protein